MNRKKTPGPKQSSFKEMLVAMPQGTVNGLNFRERPFSRLANSMFTRQIF